jgi:LCP family protein required for cell wall assembly
MRKQGEYLPDTDREEDCLEEIYSQDVLEKRFLEKVEMDDFDEEDEEGEDSLYEDVTEPQPSWWKRHKKKVLSAAIAVCLLLLGTGIAVFANYKQQAEEVVADEDVEIEVAEPVEYLQYNGENYLLNEDMVTILLMGIDDETYTEVAGNSWQEVDGQFNGGQADALFLLTLNPHTKQISVISINRNTMTMVDRFDADGYYVGMDWMQICLQHGYGDGQEQSCKRQVKAVSRLFYDIPIDYYMSISMDAIPELNDAVGGVTLEVLEDLIDEKKDLEMWQGETRTLYGIDAYWYLRYRDTNVFASNDMRLERQKQYLKQLTTTVKEKVKSDFTVAYDLYKVAQKYTVTNLGFADYVRLAAKALKYDFSMEESFYSIPGETVMGEKYEEFEVDQAAFYELVLETFYEKVEE